MPRELLPYVRADRARSQCRVKGFAFEADIEGIRGRRAVRYQKYLFAVRPIERHLG